MKNVRKIIVFFITIFLVGITVALIIVDSSLKKDASLKAFDIEKDSIYILKTEQAVENI